MTKSYDLRRAVLHTIVGASFLFAGWIGWSEVSENQRQSEAKAAMGIYEPVEEIHVVVVKLNK